MYKYILLIIVLLLIPFIFFKKDDSVKGVQSNTRIAVCPTMYKRFNGLDGIDLVLTNSTSSSVQELKNNRVEYVLSGRVPKPEENITDFIILKEGMSFISMEEGVYFLRDVLYMDIYTDKDIDESIFKNIHKVDNVYSYLDKGLVITSWENTDYSRANVVHIMNEYGSRWEDSRTPVIYCMEKCDSNFVESLIIWK
jgi:hypothetical protein